MSWHPITCERSDALLDEHEVVVLRGRTDPDGEDGEPVIFREWGHRATETPLLRDYRYPHTRPCEHYEYTEEAP